MNSTKRRDFPLGFFYAKMGFAFFEKGKNVIIPYLCISASSTIRSFFRWIGIGRLWLYTTLSSFGLSFTLNSVFIPLSILCLATISRFSSRIISTACFSNSANSVSVQSNRFINLIRDCTSSLQFSFFFSCSSRSSLMIGICIGV